MTPPSSRASTSVLASKAHNQVLSLHGIRKSYGAVEALRGVDFELRAGEVHGLLGDNGAGKSTLLKVATGVVQPDDGQIMVGGEPVEMASPLDARRLGIETVYQDLALSQDRSCLANIFAGRELLRPGILGRLGFLDRAAMAKKTLDAFADLSVTITDATAPVRRLSGGQKQGVAIARAALWAKQVVLLDEPTASLGVPQRAQVARLVTRLRARGFGVVLISHDVLEVLKVADRVTVMRMGTRVDTRATEEIDVDWVINAMVAGNNRRDDATESSSHE